MKSQTTTVVTRGTTITRGPVSAILVARGSTSLKPWMNITELDTNFGSIRASRATTSLSTLVYSLTTTPTIIKDFMLGKLSPIPGELPTFNDWENHLATIFPEVRLKGNLEMRGADGGPWRRLCALSAFWVKVLIHIEGNEVNEFVGVGGCFGPTLESKEKHANQTRLALADLPHCCITPENKLTEGVMLVHHWGNCSFMAKANVAEAAGASAILIINNRAVGTILCASYWSAWSARETAIEQDKLLKDASEDFSMETMGSTDVVDISNSLCFDCFWFIEVLVVLFAIGGAEGLQTCLVVLLTRPPVNLEFQESRQREAICNSR